MRSLPLLVSLLLSGAPESLAAAPSNLPTYPGVTLSPSVSGPVHACTPVTLELQVVDSSGAPLQESSRISLCAAQGSSATIESHTLSAVERSELCITSGLSDKGEGQVTWSNTVAETVGFIVSVDRVPTDELALTWEAASFSAAHSTLSFQDTAEELPGLRTFTGKRGLYFEPRDTCGAPTRLPEGLRLSFQGSSPLVAFTPPVQEEDGRWLTYVRLAGCPDSGQEPLSLWPTLDGQPLTLPDSDTRLQRQVKPLCLPPELQLSLRTEPEGRKAMPGELMDFVLEMRNEGQLTFPAGLLQLSTEGLTRLEPSLDGTPLTVKSPGFLLGELPPTTTRTVRVRAQADPRPDAPVRMKASYSTLGGFPLTEDTRLDVQRAPLVVDVGQGCAAGGPLSSPLPSLLLLLTLASRSWANSRRVRRHGSSASHPPGPDLDGPGRRSSRGRARPR